MNARQADTRNQLLRALSGGLFSKLSGHLRPIVLTRDQKLCKPNVPHGSIVFPDAGLVSIVETSTSNWHEVGLCGNEGAAGVFGLLSPGCSLFLEVVQVPGSGHEVDMAVLRELAGAEPELRDVLLSYVRTLLFQLSLTAVVNVSCTVEQRLARWLMMIQDRLGSDQLALTHDYISVMLGVARSSVSLSLAALERQELIATGRRFIQILNRDGLARICGRYYGQVEDEYGRTMQRHGPRAG